MTFIMILTIIITVAGFFSWRFLFLTRRFEALVTQRQQDIVDRNEALNDLTLTVTSDINKMKTDFVRMEARAFLLIYDLMIKEERYEEAASWGLKSVSASIRLDLTSQAANNLKLIKSLVGGKFLKKDKLKKLSEEETIGGVKKRDF